MSKDQAIIVRVSEAPLERPAKRTPAPATKRRAPRKRSGGPIIKIRLTADNEEDALAASAIVEELLAQIHCRMQRPRQGTNPKYADDPKWMAYGDFDLRAAGKTKARKKK